MKEAVVCVATIFIRTFGMQLLAKNSNVKELEPDTNRSDRYAVTVRINRRSSAA